MRRAVAARDRAVRQQRPRARRVRRDVDVRRAPRVVAREDGLELQGAVDVGCLDAAAVGGVEVGGVAVGVAVAASGDAGVDACRVAVPGEEGLVWGEEGGGAGGPEVKGDAREGLAGVCVDELNVHVERDAGHVVGDVGAEELADYVFAGLSVVRWA